MFIDSVRKVVLDPVIGRTCLIASAHATGMKIDVGIIAIDVGIGVGIKGAVKVKCSDIDRITGYLVEGVVMHARSSIDIMNPDPVTSVAHCAVLDDGLVITPDLERSIRMQYGQAVHNDIPGTSSDIDTSPALGGVDRCEDRSLGL